MDHLTTTKAVVKRKRKRLSKKHPPPQWGVVRGMLHMRIKDVAADLGVPISYLRRLCKENRYPKWPGKTIRYMNRTGRNLMLQVGAPEGSPLAGLAGPSQPDKIAETKKEEEDHPPKELVTLNLIDNIGSSSGSKSN